MVWPIEQFQHEDDFNGGADLKDELDDLATPVDDLILTMRVA